jgi:cytochrome c
MRLRKTVIAGLAILVCSGAAYGQQLTADQAKALMVKGDCVTCHAVDKQVVGPAYVAVAKKYKGDAKAPEQLFAKVRAGGSGSFGLVGPHGDVRMPPNPQEKISDADLRKLIAWILGLS